MKLFVTEYLRGVSFQMIQTIFQELSRTRNVCFLPIALSPIEEFIVSAMRIRSLCLLASSKCVSIIYTYELQCKFSTVSKRSELMFKQTPKPNQIGVPKLSILCKPIHKRKEALSESSRKLPNSGY